MFDGKKPRRRVHLKVFLRFPESRFYCQPLWRFYDEWGKRISLSPEADFVETTFSETFLRRRWRINEKASNAYVFSFYGVVKLSPFRWIIVPGHWRTRDNVSGMTIIAVFRAPVRALMKNYISDVFSVGVISPLCNHLNHDWKTVVSTIKTVGH